MEERIVELLKYGSLLKKKKTDLIYKFLGESDKKGNYQLGQVIIPDKWADEDENKYTLRIMRDYLESTNVIVINIADLICFYEPFGLIKIIKPTYELIRYIKPLEEVLFKYEQKNEFDNEVYRFLPYSNDEYHFYLLKNNGSATLYHICEFGEMIAKNHLNIFTVKELVDYYLKGD